jgi:ABC-2 type transport system permease protein
VNGLRLVDTELRRFQARRAVRWLVALCLLVALIVNVVQLARSSASTSYDRGDVFGQLPAACRIGTRDGLPLADLRCLERAGVGFGIRVPAHPPDTTPVVVRSFHDKEVQVGRTFEETIRGLGIAFTLLGVLLGSTFLAAEFGSAGLSTQLLFEPRRVRLYLAKASGVFVGCALCAVVVIAWVGLLQFAVSAMRGSTSGLDAGWLAARLGDTGRVAATCGLAGICAIAVGSLARRTVVAVGIFFGLVIATGFLAGVSWGKPLGRMSPMNALFAMGFADFSDPEAFIGLRTLGGAVFLALVWVTALSIVGGWWFVRREVR